MSFWAIIEPRAATNFILNPSAESTGNYAAHNSATVARATTHARYGIYCYSVTLGGTNRGINLTTASLSATDSYVSFYVRGTVTGAIQVSLNSGTNYTAASIIGGVTGGWVRYGAAVVAAQVTAGGTAVILRDTLDDTLLYIDAVQVEQTSYATTYLDGDRSGCRWSGLRHGSSSSRSAQSRLGGRERDLYDDFGIGVFANFNGVGMPPLTHNIQPLALQPGAVYDTARTAPRTVSLVLDIEGATWPGLHQKRQDLINLLKPDATANKSEPVWLVYKGATSTAADKAWLRVHYEGGGEFGNAMTFREQPIIRLLATEPYWVEDNQEAVSLDFTDSVSSAARTIARINGDWQALGSGMNGIVFAVVHDPATGRTYFGGDFTTANGVTVNGICYWNGTTFVAMGNGIAGGASERVRAIAIAPNGDVWIGGAFTTVDGTASRNNIARWNYSTGTWTNFGTTGTGTVYAIAIHPVTGVVYVGGSFTNWNANANSDYIVTYDGASWAAMGTGADNTVSALVFDKNNDLYLGGLFDNINGVSASSVAMWDGSTFTALSTGVSSGGSEHVRSISVSADNLKYLAGTFTSAAGITVAGAATWNGSAFSDLGGGVSGGSAIRVLVLADGRALYTGSFTTAGELTITDRHAFWNGYTWTHDDINFPGSPFVYGACEAPNGDLYFGFDTTGTATSSGQTSVTPLATVETQPVFTVLGPSSGSCVLQWLENQSTGQVMYFNLTVYAGESVTIDPQTGVVVSSWRGSITDQPLSNSDFTNWRLLPERSDGLTANVVAAFITGTTTGVELLLHYQPQHWSADGVA